MQQKTGRIDLEWLRRLRQRSKISFSKDRYDDKLRELASRIESLHRIRKHVEHIEDITRAPEASLSESVDYFRLLQLASSRLHDALETHWRCPSSQVHFANICLEAPEGETRDIHFDLAWSCPGPANVHSKAVAPIRLSIEAFLEPQTLSFERSHLSDHQKALESMLGKAAESNTIGPQSKAIVGSGQSSITHFAAVGASVLDLHTVPDLCHHLIRQPTLSATSHCIGFLQKTKTFRHVIYGPISAPPPQNAMRTLEDALQAAKCSADGIPLPEKLSLAKLLALAVLRFHSTPWLDPQWQSQDVVFFNVRDFSVDPLRMPFLRSSVRTQASAVNEVTAQIEHSPDQRAVVQGKRPMRSHVRNQTLYNLAIMLIELAYNSPIKDLQAPEDNQGDLLTSYWTAERLAENVRKVLGQRYAEAVKICLHCGFGPSDDLDDLDLQGEFFSKVVRKLEKCADAVSI